MQHWRLVTSPVTNALDGAFDPLIVLVSILVASLAAFTALAVVERAQATPAATTRRAWIALGSAVLGMGIWAMHFTGMLAYSLPIPVSFAWGWTVASILPALIGGYASVLMMSQPTGSARWVMIAGATLAVSIGAMHYAGMEGMELDAIMLYHAGRFVLSLVVALALASAALYVRFVIGDRRGWRFRGLALGGGLIGLSISGMHYTAMTAVAFVPTGVHTTHRPWIPPALLVAMVAGIVALIATVTLVATVADSRIREARGVAREKTNRHRAVLTLIGEGYLIVTPAGQIVSVNESAERMLGQSADGLVGQPVNRYLVMDPGDRVTQPGMPERGFPLASGRAVARLPEGKAMPVELRLYRSEIGGQEEIEILFHDITQRLALEQQLAQAQKLEAVGQLSAGIAHEINTPIQYVGDNTRFLQEAFDDLALVIAPLVTLKEAARQYPDLAAACEAADAVALRTGATALLAEIPTAIEQTLEGVDRAATIVRAMKEFSHPVTEKILIDLNRAIGNTVTVASNEWKYVAELSTDLDPELPPVPCVPGEINQVILNLIVNAAHAIGETRLATGGKGRIGIATRREGGYAVVRISDTGGGIPERIRGRIFDPFFTTKPVGKGTGQGLNLAHAVVVRKHRGGLTFETEEGVGTTFEVRLPLEPMESAG